jgi:hypothetical protein
MPTTPNSNATTAAIPSSSGESTMLPPSPRSGEGQHHERQHHERGQQGAQRRSHARTLSGAEAE